MKTTLFVAFLIPFISFAAFSQIQIGPIDLIKITGTAQTLPQVRGEIKKIDLEQNKLTIKHQEIPNLDMPGMTMVFKVDSKIDVSTFKIADQILFTVDKINGSFIILTLKKAN